MDFLGITLSCGMLVDWFFGENFAQQHHWTYHFEEVPRLQGSICMHAESGFQWFHSNRLLGSSTTLGLSWFYKSASLYVPPFMSKKWVGPRAPCNFKSGILDSFLDSCFYFSRLVTPGLDPFSLRSARCLAQNGLPRQPGGDPQVPRSK